VADGYGPCNLDGKLACIVAAQDIDNMSDTEGDAVMITASFLPCLSQWPQANSRGTTTPPQSQHWSSAALQSGYPKKRGMNRFLQGSKANQGCKGQIVQGPFCIAFGKLSKPTDILVFE
jgi:hypothetical protein